MFDLRFLSVHGLRGVRCFCRFFALNCTTNGERGTKLLSVEGCVNSLGVNVMSKISTSEFNGFTV